MLLDLLPPLMLILFEARDWLIEILKIRVVRYFVMARNEKYPTRE
jgi:hypothetical protein